MRAWKSAATGLLLILAAGCTDLTEYGAAFDAGLHLVTTPELTVAASSGPIASARCVLPLADRVWVATTEGRVIEMESGTLIELRSWSVGPPFTSGYFEMVRSYGGSYVYMIGGLSSLLQLDVVDGSVLDEFTVCDAPVLLLPDRSEPYLFVADAAGERILEVSQSQHSVRRSVSLYASPLCMEHHHTPDTMLVGTDEGALMLSSGGAGIIGRRPVEEDVPLLALARTGSDSVMCGVMGPGDDDEVVTITRLMPDSMEPGFRIWSGAVPIQGSPHMVAGDTDSFRAYVLSYLGEGESRLVCYNYRTSAIERELVLPGYPMDMEATGEGNLMVLTTE